MTPRQRSVDVKNDAQVFELAVAAIMPLFLPGQDAVANIVALSHQVRFVYLVNDGPSFLSPEFRAGVNLPNVCVIDAGVNRGIAAALNTGIQEALSRNATFLITVDQDTALPIGHVDLLLHEMLKYQFDSTVAGCTGNAIQGTTYACQHSHLGSACSVEAIQSGMLLKSSAYKAVGGLNEALFIDGVDTELMLRLHARGSHVLLVPTAHIQHTIGAPASSKFLKWSVTTDNHSANRRYYMTRNKIYLLRKYSKQEPEWAVTVKRRLIRQTLIAILFENNRRAKFSAALVGAIHAVSGRLGARH